MNRRVTIPIILFSILVLATILRSWHLHSIPYTSDELGALARTHQPTFHDEIANAVKIDAHPAGVQIFLYYWTKLFGYSETAVKLPFIICGILSVLLIFLIANEWFNYTVALVCASFLATLEYTIMYSQIARPYASGLFFSLAMVWHWSKIIFSRRDSSGKPEKDYNRHVFFYALFSALCAYNHHFSLLFAAMVGITGLLFLRGRFLRNYIIAGLCIFILYIPHLHIFFYQLHVGGIGQWLGKPKNTFILHYLQYAFQFSTLAYIMLVLLFGFGLFTAIQKKKFASPYYLISWCWFLIPFLTGFFYSKYVSPVLQYSCLLFSFPFLLFALFGLLPNLNGAKNFIFVFIICSVNVFALTKQRDYYSIFYSLHNERQVVINDSITKRYGSNNLIALAQSRPDSITAFYQRKYHTHINYSWFPDSVPKYQLSEYLEGHKTLYLSYDYIAGSNPEYLPIILNYYPHIILTGYCHEGTNYLFSSTPSNDKSNYFFKSIIGHDSVYMMDSLHEWAPGFESTLGKISTSKNDLILVSISLLPLKNLNDVLLVSTIESKDSTLLWRGTPVSKFLIKDTKKLQRAYHVIDLSSFNGYKPDLKVKIYIWNKGKKNFCMNDFKISTLPGNPVLYGLWEKLE